MTVENRGDKVLWTCGGAVHVLEVQEALDIAAELIGNAREILARSRT